MEYNVKIIWKMKAAVRVNRLFGKILDELPKPENTLMVINSDSYLSTTQNGQIINYDSFYKIVYNCVQAYIPSENENILTKVIKNIPRTIRNIKRIEDNREILEFQNKILEKYFYDGGEYNLKNKILDLKQIIDEATDYGKLDLVDNFLCDFEMRMQQDLGEDLQKLQRMLKKRG